DAAKGLEVQTMKLFEVCKHRGIPIVTVINKWDRAGLEPLALMDEIHERTGMLPTPLTWPVGQSGDFRGVLDRQSGDYTKYSRDSGGASIAEEQTFGPDEAPRVAGVTFTTAVGEAGMRGPKEQQHEQTESLPTSTAPEART